ncbi:TPA: hypothetical protein EYN65_18280 [Candidatus Poribacteria bacterium]|nr:hypothetical protein [Candidatus Poribacteria bacterium]HIO06107.1 hypothetical protein [Candidatus Poribacteria bacterium]
MKINLITGTLSQLEQQGKVGSSETLGLLQDQLKLELADIQKLLDDLAQENTDIRDQLKTLEQVTDSGSA